MDWLKPTILIGGVILAVFLLKRILFLNATKAQELLRQGAMIIDVRSRGEFESGHVPGAINIPLGELRVLLPTMVADKNEPLLVHCLSGGRSAIAKNQLHALGYTQVHNLGSLRRAQQLYRNAKPAGSSDHSNKAGS